MEGDNKSVVVIALVWYKDEVKKENIYFKFRFWSIGVWYNTHLLKLPSPTNSRVFAGRYQWFVCGSRVGDENSVWLYCKNSSGNVPVPAGNHGPVCRSNVSDVRQSQAKHENRLACVLPTHKRQAAGGRYFYDGLVQVEGRHTVGVPGTDRHVGVQGDHRNGRRCRQLMGETAQRPGDHIVQSRHKLRVEDLRNGLRAIVWVAQ